MQQGGGVNELDRRGQLDMAVAAIAAGMGGGEGEHGPQALAAGFDQMPRQVGDQLHGRAHALEDELVAGLHVGGDQGVQALDRRNAGLAGMFLLVCWPAHLHSTGPWFYSPRGGQYKKARSRL